MNEASIPAAQTDDSATASAPRNVASSSRDADPVPPEVLDLTSLHDWHHAVPRERSASGARMSITLRHSRPAGR